MAGRSGRKKQLQNANSKASQNRSKDTAIGGRERASHSLENNPASSSSQSDQQVYGLPPRPLLCHTIMSDQGSSSSNTSRQPPPPPPFVDGDGGGGEGGGKADGGAKVTVVKQETQPGKNQEKSEIIKDETENNDQESVPLREAERAVGAVSTGSGGAVSVKTGRKGDPRMHRAVAARLSDPKLSLFDALRIGGFDYPHDDDSSCIDAEKISLGQRKNQLSRRVRLARKHRQAQTGQSPPPPSTQKQHSPPRKQQQQMQSASDHTMQTATSSTSSSSRGGGQPSSADGEQHSLQFLLKQKQEQTSRRYSGTKHTLALEKDQIMVVEEPPTDDSEKNTLLAKFHPQYHPLIVPTVASLKQQQQQQQMMLQQQQQAMMQPFANQVAQLFSSTSSGSPSQQQQQHHDLVAAAAMSQQKHQQEQQEHQQEATRVMAAAAAAAAALNGSASGVGGNPTPPVPQPAASGVAMASLQHTAASVGLTLEQLALTLQSSSNLAQVLLSTTSSFKSQQDMALALYENESRSLCRKVMLLAGYRAEDVRENSSQFVQFAMMAWQAEGRRLQEIMVRNNGGMFGGGGGDGSGAAAAAAAAAVAFGAGASSSSMASSQPPLFSALDITKMISTIANTSASGSTTTTTTTPPAAPEAAPARVDTTNNSIITKNNKQLSSTSSSNPSTKLQSQQQQLDDSSYRKRRKAEQHESKQQVTADKKREGEAYEGREDHDDIDDLDYDEQENYMEEEDDEVHDEEQKHSGDEHHQRRHVSPHHHRHHQHNDDDDHRQHACDGDGDDDRQDSCGDSRHMHRLEGKCGHKAILHQPENGSAHIDFLVGDHVECYEGVQPLQRQANSMWPSKYKCSEVDCALQCSDLAGVSGVGVSASEPKILNLQDIDIEGKEWNFSFSGDESLLGLFRLHETSRENHGMSECSDDVVMNNDDNNSTNEESDALIPGTI